MPSPSTTRFSSIPRSRSSVTTVRDYQHAARIFVDSQFRLSPKYGFLFYVEFDFNPLISNLINQSSNPQIAQEIGMLVKTVSLPKYSIDTKIHNAYNRKNIVQNKINYDPVSIVFHDDQSDNIRNFWYDYYNFFYRDPDYADSTYTVPHKYQSRASFDWGYSPKASVGYNNANGNQPYQYIQAIRIYSLYQKQFSEYELINPVITSFRHGEHANGGDAGLMQHEMSVQFETVKYFTGYVTQNNVGGFIDLHYDSKPSPLTGPDGVNVVSDMMGGTTQANDTITDLASVNPSLGQLAPFSFNNSTLIGPGAYSNLQNLSVYAAGAAGTTNSGGFSIPNLGSLNGAPITGAQIAQQVNGTLTGLAGTASAKLTGAVVTGLNKAGVSNSQLSALVTVISNPKLALTTVENMAVNWALGKATTFVTGLIDKGAGYVADQVGAGASYLGQTTLGQGVQNAFSAFGSANFSVGSYWDYLNSGAVGFNMNYDSYLSSLSLDLG